MAEYFVWVEATQRFRIKVQAEHVQEARDKALQGIKANPETAIPENVQGECVSSVAKVVDIERMG